MPRRTALAAVAGVCCFLGYAGFELWPLSFLAFVPLLAALESATPRQSLLIGATFGLVTNLGGYYWLVGTIRDFGGFPVWLALPFFVVLCLYQGFAFAVMGWLFAFARRGGAPAILALPAALVAAERLWPLLFPFYLGNALHAHTTIMQIADLGGPMTVSALMAVTGAGLHHALIPPRRWREPAVAAVFLVAALGYGRVRLAQVDAAMAAAPALRVGMVQVSMGIFEKDLELAEGLRRHLTQTKQLEALPPEQRPELIVWPESGFNELVPEAPGDVRRILFGEAVRTPLLFGGLRRELTPGERARLYNSSFLLDEQGRIAGSYDKQYLLLFGEYLPFGEWLPFLYDWSPHTGRFTPGRRIDPIAFGPWKLGVIICYEDILPRFVRTLVRHGDPDLLVNLTNDAWFGDSMEPWIHLALAQSRAIEHRRFMVRSTNSGVSAFIDAAGRVTAHTSVFTRENLTGEVRMMKMWTLYSVIGDALGWMGLLVALSFGRRRPR